MYVPKKAKSKKEYYVLQSYIASEFEVAIYICVDELNFVRKFKKF